MTTLLDLHDVLLADLDGTLYRGPVAVPGAVAAVRHAAEQGVRTVYVTNNASRRPADVASHLAELGFAATADDVVASSQAAAAMLAGQLPAGAPVLVVGTDALAEEVIGVGLSVVDRADGAVGVVQGHSPDTGWRLLAEATVALRAGAVWVACNLDPTLPTDRGPLPGNGSMVAALRMASGREPQVAGKPAPALITEAVRRSGARSPLMIGDRLDTDIEGGRAVGMATLLVLTGVSDAAELLAAPAALRPDHIGVDMGALGRSVGDLAPGPRPGWTVESTSPGELTLRTDGAPPEVEAVDALRALCGAHWASGGGPVRVAAGDDVARTALRDLGLSATSTRDGAAVPDGAAVGDDAAAPDRTAALDRTAVADSAAADRAAIPVGAPAADRTPGAAGSVTVAAAVSSPGAHR